MIIHSQRIPAIHNSGNAPELVLFHGWGMSSTIWHSLVVKLRQQANVTLVDLPGYGASEKLSDCTFESLIRVCEKILPSQSVLIGYSLGGMLATELAARNSGKVSALITLAANVRFVASEAWSYAMEASVFENFQRSVAKPAIALKRFHGLQAHGGEEEKLLLKELRANNESINEEVLSQSLNWLAAFNLIEALSQLSLPSLHCFGEKDALVPVEAAQQMQAQFDKNISILDGAPHAFLLSHAEQCYQGIENFLRENQITSSSAEQCNSRKKQAVAQSFSRAASTYDSVADLQRKVGENLLNQLPETPGAIILDLGCGTGFFVPHLQQKVVDGFVAGVDIAEGMAHFAVNKNDDFSAVCGDAEDLPFLEESIDVVFSSLAIQWCENINALFTEMYRVLKPGGRFIFSTLGPNTLCELRQAWEQVDNYTHVNQFADKHVVEQAVSHAGFIENDQGNAAWLKEESMTLEYQTLKQLTAELKSLGAHNVNKGRPVGLMGKKRLQQFIEGYELQRNKNGKLPASYQVWYGVVTKSVDLNR